MKLTLRDFTVESRAYNIIRELKNDGIHQKSFSDVIDEKGNQYVDLVLEGGGVLGIALTGYTYVLEQAGLRFRGIAGASAGAINALLLAACDIPEQSKSETAITELSRQNLYEFVDGPSKVKTFINRLLAGKANLITAFYGWRILGHFKRNLGLNPGDAFTRWIAGILQEHDADSTMKLNGKMRLPDSLQTRDGIDRTVEGLEASLVMIATDITTESRIKFPEMADLYWDDPAEVNPAEYVRASMSIPGFFYPKTVEVGDDITEERRNKWIDKVKFNGPPPEKAVFVDGGMVSNFPIDVFHGDGVPRLPTFGVKLGSDREEVHEIDRPGAMGMALFNTARHIHDYEFILRHPDYSHLVSHIDVGSHNWLNFSISDDDKIDLFERGAKAADYFLRTFDWEEYKSIRGKLSS